MGRCVCSATDKLYIQSKLGQDMSVGLIKSNQLKVRTVASKTNGIIEAIIGPLEQHMAGMSSIPKPMILLRFYC